jgi:dissimilatory sulfite reductase (desulfoviridin) alpha/beta subunit
VLSNKVDENCPAARTIKCIKCGKEKAIVSNEICGTIGHLFVLDSCLHHSIGYNGRGVRTITQRFWRCKHCDKIIFDKTEEDCLDGKWEFINGRLELRGC